MSQLSLRLHRQSRLTVTRRTPDATLGDHLGSVCCAGGQRFPIRTPQQKGSVTQKRGERRRRRPRLRSASAPPDASGRYGSGSGSVSGVELASFGVWEPELPHGRVVRVVPPADDHVDPHRRHVRSKSQPELTVAGPRLQRRRQVDLMPTTLSMIGTVIRHSQPYAVHRLPAWSTSACTSGRCMGRCRGSARTRSPGRLDQHRDRAPLNRRVLFRPGGVRWAWHTP